MPFEYSLDINSAADLLPRRASDSHKGSFGKVLLICGSKNMVGCAVLATEGALRSGVGLVTLAFPDSLYIPLASRLTENLFYPLKSDGCSFDIGEVPSLVEYASSFNAVLIGPGISVCESTKALVKGLVIGCTSPLIIDADGLNCIAEFPEILLRRKCEILLTPHPGEMARLTNASPDAVQLNRKKVIEDFCREYNVNVLLKGSRTLICDKTCSEIYINYTGNSGLSKGGSGDLLSGIITALCSLMNGDLFKAGVLGAFIHGLCADILKKEISEYSMLPSDCAAGLNKVYMLLEEYR